jgi:ParB family chromosome partitioning protein
MLSSITVRPVLDDGGAETGIYTIPAGGRRFRALELLVKQKRTNKTDLVPCIARTDGLSRASHTACHRMAA